MHCAFEEFRENNAINQILKAAVVFLLKRARSGENRRLLGELRLMFGDVDGLEASELPWDDVKFDRLTHRYESSYRLAELILGNTPPEIASGQFQGFSLFFNMNGLFEEYIGRIDRQVLTPLGFTIRLQTPRPTCSLIMLEGVGRS
ncbi:MAG: hypothetical protein JWR80_6351 [Bradyrhizobium sp.]|nr:hypothetical protein [Bradyrhizobium sp.]